MADVLVIVMPFAGHVTPLLHATEALRAAGHRVRVYTGSAYAHRVAAVAATHVPWRHAPDFDERDPAATFHEVGRPGPRGVLANMEHLFVRTGVGQVADLDAEFDRAPWDVLVGDSLSIGGSLVSELLATPWASVSVVPLSMASRDLPPPGFPLAPGRGPLGRGRDAVLRGLATAATGRLRAAYRHTRAAVGLPPGGRPLDEGWFSPSLVMALGIHGLEAPRSHLPQHVHFVGTFPAAGSSAPLRPWWDDVVSAGRPIVHVTQGTFNTDPDELIRPSLEALADRDVTVLVATGVRGRDTLPFAVPPNARVAGLLPYDRLLPRTDVMVTNRGWGGVLTALSHGIPLVVAGGDLDKPMIAGMVARSGAGIDLRTGHPRAAAVGAAVDRITGDPSYRKHAGRLAEQLAQHDTAGEVVELVERLLATGGPVLRASDPWAASR